MRKSLMKCNHFSVIIMNEGNCGNAIRIMVLKIRQHWVNQPTLGARTKYEFDPSSDRILEMDEHKSA